MASLDIFSNDPAFSLFGLTQAITDLPFTPTLLTSLGWFSEVGISTTSMGIERVGQTLSLVPTQPRAGVPTRSKLDRANLRHIAAVHIPQGATIMADEVQNVRAFGTETETQTVQRVVNKHLALQKAKLDLTMEFQRMGAVNGVIYDADGTTVLWDLFDLFGMTPTTHDMHLDVTTTDVRAEILHAKRKMEDKLGGYLYTSIRALCSPEFMDAFIGHPNVQAAWLRYQESGMLRSDPRGGFEYGQVTWQEYRSGNFGVTFIPAGEARMVPEGITGLFSISYAPANYMETVNTTGLPYYARQQLLDMNKGVELETQTNPITLCQRPEAIVHLSATHF